MKLFYLPLNMPESPQIGLTGAFEKVFELTVFDYMARQRAGLSKFEISTEFYKLVRSVHPDIIHMQLHASDIIDPTVLLAIKDLFPDIFLTHWHGDMMPMNSSTIQIMKPINAICDLTLVSNKGQLREYELYAEAKKALYWQIGVVTDEPHPDRTRWPYNAVFTATNRQDTYFPNNQRRYDLALKATRLFGFQNFIVYGNGWGPEIQHAWPVPFHEHLNCLASAKVVFSFSHTSTCHSYFSDRLLYCLASGRPVIADRFPGCDDFFSDKVELFYFDIVEEAIDLAQWVLAHQDEARIVGECGRSRCIKQHSWDVRAREYIEILRSQGVKA